MYHQIRNPDLFPGSPEPPKDDDSMQRAFIQAQLVIFRARDRNANNLSPETFELLTVLADEICAIAQKWHEFNSKKERAA